MSPDTIATLAAAAVIAGFLWTLHRDMRAMDTRIGRDIADLRERMARLEGSVDVLAKFLMGRDRGREEQK